MEVLLNPTLLTLTQCLRNVLRSPTNTVHIIYAGATFEETGSWILKDGTFSAYNFYELVEEKQDQKAGTVQQLSPSDGDTNVTGACNPCKGHCSIAEHLSCHDIVIHFHTQPAGEWCALQNIFANQQFDAHSSMTSSMIMQNLNKPLRRNSRGSQTNLASATVEIQRRHLFHFDLNPPDSMTGVEGSAALLDFLSEKLRTNLATLCDEQCQTVQCLSGEQLDTIGYVRLDRPTLYIFPGGQGDCALFGLDNGFSMLLDGGYLPAHKSFWNFVRHLERLDSIVVCKKTFEFSIRQFLFFLLNSKRLPTWARTIFLV